MTRGFVTIATGKDNYYYQARNLLRSFRLYNQGEKFAIICDRINEFTEEFDDVIILQNCTFSYRDKFRILTDCPYDENIFIETDCLVYKNLEHFWTLLSKEWDFSSFGWNDGKPDTWFANTKCLEEISCILGGQIVEKYPIFNPGYLFIRKGVLVEKMYRDIFKIEEHLLKYWKDDIKLFVDGNLRDDPLFCLAMEINGMKCAAEPCVGKCISLPAGYRIEKIDILAGKLDVIDTSGSVICDCSLLHFSTRRVLEEGLYPWQVAILNSGEKSDSRIWIWILRNRLSYFFYSSIRFVKRNANRALSILKNPNR